MVFSSIIFVFTFLPITLLIYFLTPVKCKNFILLAASLIFYAWGEPIYIFLMVLSILINYFCGIDIDRNMEEPEKARRSVTFAIVVNLLILGFFKYYVFFIESLNRILPIDLPYKELALPVGISFYTFQILSYIIDVYRGTVKAQKNLISFGVYVTMFPQLVAGPIVQYSDIERQLKKRKHSMVKFGSGTVLFISGLSKKVLLANMIGMLFTEISGMNTERISVLTAWIGCLAYTFQIYFDFSGYSDMAVGLGRMFGFEFVKNFNYPYTSKSITEFWRRWHISLGSWFRDYVYIPLGGNRTTTGKHIRNIMVVWILTGLWHGANWNFVVWGLYYGIILLIEKYFLSKYMQKLPAIITRIYSMLLIMIGWVFFFSTTLGDAIVYLKHMFGIGVHAVIDAKGISLLMPNVMLFIILAFVSTPIVNRIFEKMKSRKMIINVAAKCLVYTGLLFLCVAYMITETYNPFLYFRF